VAPIGTSPDDPDSDGDEVNAHGVPDGRLFAGPPARRG
jgi:hypothetical protein